MKFVKALDIKKEVKKLISQLHFNHLDDKRIICFRSFGSTSRARARIWSFPRIWQLALDLKPYYIIEVLAEHFDKLSLTDKNKVLIH